MAYTQQQINDIYQQERSAGKSDADLQRVGATQYGLTADQMSAAAKAYTPAAPAAPAATGMLSAGATPVATAAPQVGRFTQEQYDGARQWADGRSAKEILGKAAELGLTAEELGRAFGEHGGSAKQVMDATGYATASHGMRISPITGQPELNIVPWSTARDRTLDDWRYDASNTNGWVWGKKGGGGGGNQSDINFEPNMNRAIDAASETIEGRLGNLLGTDARGNYSNPVVRQAVDRAMQQMAGRGLLNSSMAAQAAQEAAIAKAIEIVGPDAERYFQQGRANQDAQNVFARDEQNYKYDLGKMGAGHGNDLEKMAFQSQLDLSKLSDQQRFELQKLAVMNKYDTEGKAEDYKFKASEAEKDRQAQLAAANISASRGNDDQSWRFQLAALEQQASMGNTRAQVVNNAYGNLMENELRISTMDIGEDAKLNLLRQQATTFNNLASANGSTLRAPIYSKADGAAAAPAPAGTGMLAAVEGGN